MKSTFKRRRGAALVRQNGKILLVAHQSKIFHLPGGGAEKGESRKKAMQRELHEELNLKTTKQKYLLKHSGEKYVYHSRSKHHKFAKDKTKLFEVEVTGKIKPQHEVKHYLFWSPSSKAQISKDTQRILQRLI